MIGKYYKNNFGFTLIEMLVVVGIIGILSSVLLTALNPSRDKAKDSRIIQEVNQVRSLLQTLDNGNYNAIPELSDSSQIDTFSNETVKGLAKDILLQGGNLRIKRSTDWYMVYSSLNIKMGGDQNIRTNYFCVDNTGKSVYTTNESYLNDPNQSGCPSSE